MDDSVVGWAIQAGLVAGAPLCLVVGTGFAVGATLSALHYTMPKLLGWLFGVPLALASGALLAPYLVPFFWPKFGAVFCSGYGWALLWTAVQILGRHDGWVTRLFARRPDKQEKFKPAAGSGADRFRLKTSAVRKGERI